MNDKAKKMARRAELENFLLDVFYKRLPGSFGDFVEWLEQEASEESYFSRRGEAKELIALYEAT